MIKKFKSQRVLLGSGADSTVYLAKNRNKALKVYESTSHSNLVQYKNMLDFLSTNLKSILEDQNFGLKISQLESKLNRSIDFKITPLKQIKRINKSTTLGVCEFINGNSVYDIFFTQDQAVNKLSNYKYEILNLISTIFQKITGLSGTEFDFVNVKLKYDDENVVFIFTDILSRVYLFDF